MKKRVRIKPRMEKYHHKRKVFIFVCALFFFLMILSFFLFMPHITLKGDSSLILNVHTEYKDPGYDATAFFQNVKKKVVVDNSVNMDEIGTYEVVYRLKVYGFSIKVVRKVKVADLEAPKIVLNGDVDAFVCKDKEYQEEGYFAFDNVDGDLSDKVKIEKKKDKIIYYVVDQAGNKSQVERSLMEGDKIAPEITLLGGESVFVSVLEDYHENGYQAIDNCDGDVTSSVVVSGSVNTSVIGDYVLSYQVTDQKGNRAEVKRVVRVRDQGTAGTIYLTFDDGPKAGSTDVILDILKEEGVKATFFVTANGPDELIKREYDEGHTVGLHTASHNYAVCYASVDAYFQDLQIVHDRVERITGYDSRIIRFPGGSSNTISKRYQIGIMSTLTKEVLARGYQYYDWNVSSGDAGEAKTADEVYQNVISRLSKERINMVLMHDIKPYTRDALRQIIRYGKENGYHFEAITMNTAMVQQRVNN